MRTCTLTSGPCNLASPRPLMPAPSLVRYTAVSSLYLWHGSNIQFLRPLGSATGNIVLVALGIIYLIGPDSATRSYDRVNERIK